MAWTAIDLALTEPLRNRLIEDEQRRGA
jgi:hypothetical protein